MSAPSTETLTAIGRTTLAAVDLDRLLAEIGAPHASDLDEPGAALAAARHATRLSCDDLVSAIEGTAAQLATAHAMVRRVLTGESPAGPAEFDAMTTQPRNDLDMLFAAIDVVRGLAMKERPIAA